MQTSESRTVVFPDPVVGSEHGADPHNNKTVYAATHGGDKNTANSNRRPPYKCDRPQNYAN